MKSTAFAVAAALSSPLFSAEDESDKDDKDKVEVKVVVVGSRAAPRSVGESAVPVDILSGAEFESQGITDMNSMLSVSVPSFNVNQQPISDAATLVRPANLRGLSPDSTLILVNGKRRHRASVITFLGGGISDGSQGPDISVIPSVALKQIEVLRDGAAAQYGSDAVAGVMNMVLKDNASGGYWQVSTGQFYEGDGTTVELAGNVGLELSERGFLNLSMEYKQADPTDRSVQRTDAANLNANSGGYYNIPNPAQIWGAPEIKSDYKLFFNAGNSLDNNREIYAFGNIAEREIEGGFYFRNPITRPGVFSNDGGLTLLMGDPNNPDNSACGTVNIDQSTGIPDPTELAAAIANGCFTHHTRFRNGFTPRFGGVVSDQSLAFGMKGENENWTYDVSYTYGKNEVDFAIKNTINAAYGEDSPTSFKPGSYIQEETGFNADFTFPLHDGLIAAGIERRTEEFTIKAGDPASYSFNPNLAQQGFGIGSNGFPGFKPEFAGSQDRSNWALYVDSEWDLSAELFMTAAIRYEDYSDFGNTTNFKVSGRYQITDNVAIRSAASTGFRAPTIGQQSVQNVTTQFSNGQLQDEATFPPTHPISQYLGAKPLQPEEAVNFSIGSVMEWDNWFITVDYYHIKMEDRITLSSTQELDATDIANLVALGVLQPGEVFSGVRYFTNDFDTTTQGVDLVVNYNTELWGGDTTFGLVYNWTDTQVDRFDPDNIGPIRVRQLEENLPDVRATLSMIQKWDQWRMVARYNHYSGWYEAHLDDGTLPVEADRNATVDLEFGYNVNDQLTFTFGAQNLFDEYPEDLTNINWPSCNCSSQDIAGAKYPVTSPYGFNGGYYYFRLGYSF
jgi:iron complex outermembrane receptor protein